MTARLLAAAALIAAFGTAAAHAATIPAAAPAKSAPAKAPDKSAPPAYDTATFASLVGSEVYLKQIATLLPEAEPAAARAICRTLKLLDAGQVQVIDPPQFTITAKGTLLASGSWIAVVSADRCGETVKRRFFVHTQPDKSTLDVDPLLPGDFHGALGLERSARKVVTPALGKTANCSPPGQIEIVDVAAKGPVSDKGWSEVWTASACGTTVSGVVTYSTAPAGGTAIHVEDTMIVPQPHLPPHPDGTAAATP